MKMQSVDSRQSYLCIVPPVSSGKDGYQTIIHYEESALRKDLPLPFDSQLKEIACTFRMLKFVYLRPPVSQLLLSSRSDIWRGEASGVDFPKKSSPGIERIRARIFRICPLLGI